MVETINCPGIWILDMVSSTNGLMIIMIFAVERTKVIRRCFYFLAYICHMI